MIRVKIVSNEEAMHYLFTHNPLLVRDIYGDFEFFSSDTACYYEFMVRFYTRFAKGYCDPVLWLHENFAIHLKDAEHVFNVWRTKYNMPNEPFLIEWSNEEEAIKFLRFFMSGVLTFTDHVLCEGTFYMAFDTFSKKFNIKEHEQ